MDMIFVPYTREIHVYKLGLHLSSDSIIQSSKIQSRLLITILELIQDEWVGDVIN